MLEVKTGDFIIEAHLRDLALKEGSTVLYLVVR